MSDHDQRQFKLIADRLLDYEQDRLPLGQLIRALEALLGVIEAASDEWKDRFKAEWWTLEQVYAVNLDRNQGVLKLGPADEALIGEALSNVRNLLAEADSAA